jgi:predicted DCC family thiol-disulfide oxidoreductase YuxK
MKTSEDYRTPSTSSGSPNLSKDRRAEHTTRRSPEARGRHLLLYDGVCALCSGTVQFVLEHDRTRLFDIAALQSDAAREALKPFHLTPDDLDTFYVIADYRSSAPSVLERARAALFLAKTLGWPWRAAGVLQILPAGVLNAGYNLVARSRYRIFGRRDQCFLPQPEHRDRFIDQ